MEERENCDNFSFFVEPYRNFQLYATFLGAEEF